MKILTNFHGGNGGGHVTYIINLARALSREHQITVAAPSTSRLYRYAKAIPGVTVEDIRYTTRPSSWFGDRARLRRLIKRGGFDIIHANGSADHKQVMLATLAMARRPRIVFTKHNDHPLTSFGHKLRVALATDHGIAVSDYIHGIMAASPYGRRPITTIRHGIDTNFFAPPPPDSLDKLRELIFGPEWRGKLLLGSAGGTDYDKGWLDLVAAVAALPPEDKARVLLMVAGDPPSEAKLARARAGHDRPRALSGPAGRCARLAGVLPCGFRAVVPRGAVLRLPRDHGPGPAGPGQRRRRPARERDRRRGRLDRAGARRAGHDRQAAADAGPAGNGPADGPQRPGNSCATSTCTVSPPPRWTSTSVRWLDADLIIRSMRIPILMYHQIGEPNPKGTPFRGLTVHPSDFTRQMRWMRRLGYRGLSMRDVMPYARRAPGQGVRHHVR